MLFKQLLTTITMSCISAAVLHAQIDGFNPNQNYHSINDARLLEFTNRILNTNYTSMPTNATVDGHVNSDFLADRTSWACFSCPTNISQYYHQHRGLDQEGDENTVLHSPMDGEIIATNPSIGTIAIYNATKDITFYFVHCENIYVSTGMNVTMGQQVGTAGDLGNSTGPHIHSEIRPGYRTAPSCSCSDLASNPVYDPTLVVAWFNSSPFTQLSPTDGEVGVDVSPTVGLDWEDMPNAVAYRVEVTQDITGFDAQATPMFPNNIYSSGNSTPLSEDNGWTGANLGETYYWVVRGFDGNQSFVTPIYSFKTEGGNSCNPSGYTYDTPSSFSVDYDESTGQLEYFFVNNSMGDFVRLQVSDLSTATIAEGFYCDVNAMNYTGSISGGQLYYNRSVSCSTYTANTLLSDTMFLNPGTYYATIRVGSSGAQSEYVTAIPFNVVAVSTDNVPNEFTRIYPNPVHDQLMIETSKTIKNVYIVNTLGQHIEATWNQNQVDVDMLDRGIYYLELQMEDGQIHTYSFIKE